MGRKEAYAEEAYPEDSEDPEEAYPGEAYPEEAYPEEAYPEDSEDPEEIDPASYQTQGRRRRIDDPNVAPPRVYLRPNVSSQSRTFGRSLYVM